jgi:diaminopimelate epimerase
MRQNIAFHVEIQGTPHGILYWDNLDETPDSTIIHLGRRLRNHPAFSRGANISFTEVLDEHTLRIRTYERGVEDETLACGTGSIGASVVSYLLNRVIPPVRVKTSSGELLEVTWTGSDILASDLYLGGEVRHVVDGFILTQAYID